MIRVVCICGRRLRARDEAALRNAVCPKCGCPVGQSRPPDGTAPRPKPLLLGDGRPVDRGVALVPLWNEGLAGARVVPRYQAVTGEPSAPTADLQNESHTDSDGGERSVTKVRPPRVPRSRKLNTALSETLLFPLRCWRTIALLSLLLTFALAAGLLIVQHAGPNYLRLKLALSALPPFFAVVYCCSFWMTVLAVTVRGEDSLAVGTIWCSRQLCVQAWRCLVCFGAGPVWILIVAGFFWLYGGEINWVDGLILGELILAAFLYWWLAMLAVAIDDSLRSLAPTAISHVLRRLGWQLTVLAAGAAVLGVACIAVSAAYAFAPNRASLWILGVFVLSCVAGQTFAALLARRLGVAIFLAGRPRPDTANMPLSP